ncbi:MAG TPA: protein kinase [Vicinamibacterales bacterium]|jgi:non-specific serine/threonine protein kinase|nr:protein kinase [Vicinamibacterales bacterium]
MVESLAHYKILERIGAGGMGEVYRARDTRLGRTVAVKVLPAAVADNPERRERFLREARATAALSHPNIAALYEIGEDQGHLFLAFEYVPGETLHATIAGRPMNPRIAIGLGVQIADALADAHAEGIVHRDIKAANIIVTPKGNAKILDFGLATWTAGGAEREHAAEAATTMKTNAGTTLGTVAYMSPEQALGERVDHRTDIFSLGVVLFEMLTGKLPFTGTTPTAIALQIVQAPAPSPSSLNPSLPRELDPIVMKALAKSLDQRYESAATVAAELRSMAAILDVRAEISESEPSTLAGVRGPRKSYVGWILLILLLAALGAAAWFARDELRRMWRRTLAPTPAPVLAVMPFELNGPDTSRLYFANGLTDDVITRLGQTPGLRVIGRSSTREYRGQDPRAVAREIGAAVVLTGTVQPADNDVRVTVALVDPVDGAQIWSAQYTRELKDIFAVQAEIATDVATRLRGTLVPNAALARTASRVVDQRAYDLYLQGRDRAANRRPAEAIELFQQSIAADPGIAEAHAGLAAALMLQATFAGRMGDDAARARARAEIDNAFNIDPDLAQAHQAEALVANTIRESLEHTRAAIALDPSDAQGYHVIGDFIKELDPERAIAFYRASLDLDRRFDASRGDIVQALLLLGRREEARQEARAMTRDPVGGRVMLAEADVIQGGADPVAALGDERLEANGYVQPWVRYARALVQTGRHDAAGQLLNSILKRAPDFCEARTLAAGQLRRRNARGAAADNDSADRTGSQLRCGVVAAAVLGDASKTAALIDALAARTEAVPMDDASISGDLVVFDQRRTWYPWSQVSGDPRVVAAMQRLSAARDAFKRQLPGLLPPLPARSTAP